MDSSRTIPVWFFVGITLLLDGILILGAGVYEVAHPPADLPALFHLHAGVWWGGMLAVVGVFFSWTYAPWRCRTPR